MGIHSNIETRAELLKHGCLHNLVKSCEQHRSFWGESSRNEMSHKDQGTLSPDFKREWLLGNMKQHRSLCWCMFQVVKILPWNMLFCSLLSGKKKNTQIRQITVISNTISSTNSEQLLTVRLSFGPSSWTTDTSITQWSKLSKQFTLFDTGKHWHHVWVKLD